MFLQVLLALVSRIGTCGQVVRRKGNCLLLSRVHHFATSLRSVALRSPERLEYLSWRLGGGWLSWGCGIVVHLNRLGLLKLFFDHFGH